MNNPRQGGDPEVVIRQAMRAMAGGRRDEAARHGGRGSADGSGGSGGGGGSRLTVTQILLIAAIVGLVLGMAAGFAILLTR